MVCDCELRWYKQWIESEWNEIEETWLRETTCKDMVDDKIHVISEVDLRDMFCDSDVKDKPGKVLNSFNKCSFCWGLYDSYQTNNSSLFVFIVSFRMEPLQYFMEWIGYLLP